MTVAYQKEIPIVYETEILVCGGGSAGATCAIAAARMGAKVCLVERNNILGGVMTSGGNNEIALFYKEDKQIIKGIGWEFVTRLKEKGFAQIPEFKAGIHHSLQAVHVNIPMAGRMWDEMCMESGVKLFFKMKAVDIIRGKNSWTVIMGGDNGLCAIVARKVVDCSGDGILAVMAGAKFELSDELQPGTLRFFTAGYNLENINRERVKFLFEKGVKDGEVQSSDFWPSPNGNPRVIFEHDGNNINHIAITPDTLDDKTEIEMEGRKSVERIVNWVRKNVSGAENFIASTTSGEVAIRETRRIVCEEYITVGDYLAAKEYEDAICYAYYPVDLHKAKGETLENIFLDNNKIPTIPYRAFIPTGIEDMLIAGRCVSSDRLANSAIRVKAVCMAMGEAAGVAAVLSLKDKVGLRDIKIAELKKVLADKGCIIPW